MSDGDSDESPEQDYVFILPVFNEAAIIAKALSFLVSLLDTNFPPPLYWGIVVVDNGSHDGTYEIAHRSALVDSRISVLECLSRGRGNAIKKAIDSHSTSRVFCYLDIDIPIEEKTLVSMIDMIERGAADIVIVRRLGTRPYVRALLSFCYRVITYSLYRQPYADPQAGVKAFTGRAALFLSTRCAEQGYFLDTEFIVGAQRSGFRISEISGQWIEQRFTDRVSKVRPIRDSVAAVRALLRILKRVRRGFPFFEQQQPHLFQTGKKQNVKRYTHHEEQPK